MQPPDHHSGPEGVEPQTRRGAIARRLLSRRQFRESVALARQPSLMVSFLAGLQAALAAVVALPLTHLSPWPHLIGFAALGALAALFGRFAPPARRGRIVLLSGVCLTAAVLGMSLAGWLGAPPPLQIALLALACGVFFLVSVRGQFGPPGGLIFIFAASAAMSPPAPLGDVAQRACATAVAALLAWAVCLATEPLRQRAAAALALPQESPRPLRDQLIAALRMTLASGIVAFGAWVAGAPHPGWAAMGAVAVLQGAHLHINMNRALQRTAGTIVGAALVWLILAQAPSAWTVIGLLLVLTVATEVVIGTNYGLGQILVTPMALLMTYLAAPERAGPDMAPERALDTLAGAAVGMLFAVIFSTLDDRRHLARHHASGDGAPGAR